MKLTAYQRIIQAAKQGRGLRLSASEVHLLSLDTAIVELAGNDDAAIGGCSRCNCHECICGDSAFEEYLANQK